MIELLRITLEAHNEKRNHHRSYELTVGRDLLGDWVVTLAYGRVGKGQQRRQFGTSDKEEARRFTRGRLRRRMSAQSRIHCRYSVTNARHAPQVLLFDWTPPGLLG